MRNIFAWNLTNIALTRFPDIGFQTYREGNPKFHQIAKCNPIYLVHSTSDIQYGSVYPKYEVKTIFAWNLRNIAQTVFKI